MWAKPRAKRAAIGPLGAVAKAVRREGIGAAQTVLRRSGPLGTIQILKCGHIGEVLGASARPFVFDERCQANYRHGFSFDLKAATSRYGFVEINAINFGDEVDAPGRQPHLKYLPGCCEVGWANLVRSKRRSEGHQGFEHLLPIFGFGSDIYVDVLCRTRMTMKSHCVPANDDVFRRDQRQLNE